MDSNFSSGGTGGKPNLLLISQQLGVGKTSLAVNVFNFGSVTVSEAFKEARISVPVRKEMEQALLVYVDLPYTIQDVSQFSTLGEYVAYKMWAAARKQQIGESVVDAAVWKANQSARTVDSCFGYLRRVLNMRPLYFVFDEVQHVERYGSLFQTPESIANEAGMSNLQVRCSRLREFVSIWKELLFTPGFYAICTGVSEAIDEISNVLKGSKSPVNRVSVNLPSFNKDDLNDIVSTLRLSKDRACIREDLGLDTDEKRDSFIDWLYRISCGVPRNVIIALQGLEEANRSCAWSEILFVNKEDGKGIAVVSEEVEEEIMDEFPIIEVG